MTLQDFKAITDQFPSTAKMPGLFVGHGSPMNGIEENTFSKRWQQIAHEIPRPQAILSISAHWYTQGSFIHVAEKPRTIHDFYGFPKELYEISYDCPGAPDLALKTKQLLASHEIHEDDEWGIDHGTWIVLRQMYPDHSIPVFQLSIDATKAPQWHYELAQLLRPLREKGVLIMGSGNIVHNLGRIDFSPECPAYDWAQAFDMQAKDLILNEGHKALVSYHSLGEAAHLSIPTAEHYLPLLYVLGLKEKQEKVSFPVEGMTFGSISMRAVQVG